MQLLLDICSSRLTNKHIQVWLGDKLPPPRAVFRPRPTRPGPRAPTSKGPHHALNCKIRPYFDENYNIMRYGGPPTNMGLGPPPS